MNLFLCGPSLRSARAEPAAPLSEARTKPRAERFFDDLDDDKPLSPRVRLAVLSLLVVASWTLVIVTVVGVWRAVSVALQ